MAEANHCEAIKESKIAAGAGKAQVFKVVAGNFNEKNITNSTVS